MKEVKFQGMSFTVPQWAKWITQNAYGQIRVWEVEPLKIKNGWNFVSGRTKVVFYPSAAMVKEEI